MDLIDPATQARLDTVRGGADDSRRLTVAELDVGAWGILDVTVEQIHPARPFQRKRGGDGLVGRVRLADATGAIDMVLWDDENRLTAQGPLTPGQKLVIRGATVKAGWKGGLELGLGSAVLEPYDAEPPERLRGVLVSLSATEVVGQPPRCKAEAVLEVAGSQVTVICWDDAIKDVQGEAGDEVSVSARKHPALDGFYIA